MMKMKINVRQISFIMLAYTAVSKFLTYPTLLSYFCGRDLLFPALINFLIEGIVLWGVTFLCSRTDKTFFGLLQGTIGNIGAKIVYGLFAAYFLLATLLPVLEQEMYVQAIFYDTIPALFVFLPFFIFSVYAASKRFENIGRCADICLPVFLVTIAVIFGMSYTDVQWDNLLPMFQTPAKDVFSGASATAYRFTAPCWMLMFMGHFKYKKGDAAKITLSYAAGAAIVIFFLVTFYGIYGSIAPSRTFAISRTSLYFPAIDLLGRIDLIMLYVMETVMLFALALNIQLAVHCISKCSGWDKLAYISFFANAAIAVVLISCNSQYHEILALYSEWFWIMFIIFSVLVPSLAWTLRRRTE